MSNFEVQAECRFPLYFAPETCTKDLCAKTSKYSSPLQDLLSAFGLYNNEIVSFTNPNDPVYLTKYGSEYDHNRYSDQIYKLESGRANALHGNKAFYLDQNSMEGDIDVLYDTIHAYNNYGYNRWTLHYDSLQNSGITRIKKASKYQYKDIVLFYSYIGDIYNFDKLSDGKLPENAIDWAPVDISGNEIDINRDVLLRSMGSISYSDVFCTNRFGDFIIFRVNIGFMRKIRNENFSDESLQRFIKLIESGGIYFQTIDITKTNEFLICNSEIKNMSFSKVTPCSVCKCKTCKFHMICGIRTYCYGENIVTECNKYQRKL